MSSSSGIRAAILKTIACACFASNAPATITPGAHVPAKPSTRLTDQILFWDSGPAKAGPLYLSEVAGVRKGFDPAFALAVINLHRFAGHHLAHTTYRTIDCPHGAG